MMLENENSISIAMICDDNYVLPTCVTITSIIKSMKTNRKLDIYIFASDISTDNQYYFKTLASANVNINIKCVSADKFKGVHNATENSMCVATEAALFKFYLPELLPNLKKVLYLDGDLVVRKDISELFDYEIEGYPLAAVKDSGNIYTKNKERKRFEKYFNSGVMLLNLELLRKENASEILFKTKQKQVVSNLMDQDVFNQIFDNRILELPIVYNFLYINLLRAKEKYTIKDLNQFYHTEYLNLEEIREKSYIIHFSSKDKPWKYHNVPYGDVWEYFYAQSPCSDISLDRGFLVPKETSANHLPNIIVSLTSYPARINGVVFVVENMLNQSIKPNKILLYLAKEQFPDEEIPNDLKCLQNDCFNIIYCDNDLKPHKKYFYAMQDYSDSIIITVDDDVFYPLTLIEDLLESYKKHPQAISCMRGHTIKTYDEETYAPYHKWSKTDKIVKKPSILILPTGVGGVLYPPKCLPKETFNENAIKEICLYTDDLWLKWMQLKKNIPCVLVRDKIKLNYIEDTQENGLWKENVNERRNDTAWQAIREYCGDMNYMGESISQKLYEEYSKQFLEKKEFTCTEKRGFLTSLNSLLTLKKIKGGIQCYKEHGFIYTVKRTLEHLGIPMGMEMEKNERGG